MITTSAQSVFYLEEVPFLFLPFLNLLGFSSFDSLVRMNSGSNLIMFVNHSLFSNSFGFYFHLLKKCFSGFYIVHFIVCHLLLLNNNINIYYYCWYIIYVVYIYFLKFVTTFITSSIFMHHVVPVFLVTYPTAAESCRVSYDFSSVPFYSFSSWDVSFFLTFFSFWFAFVTFLNCFFRKLHHNQLVVL